MNGPAFSVRLIVSITVLQDVIKIKSHRQGYCTGFVGNATAVVSFSKLRNKFSKFYKLSSFLNKTRT